MAHAAQVALALFAYICGEDTWAVARAGRCWHGGGPRPAREGPRESGGVVADTRGVDAGAVFFFDGFLDEGVGLGKTVSRCAERRTQGGRPWMAEEAEAKCGGSSSTAAAKAPPPVEMTPSTG